MCLAQGHKTVMPVRLKPGAPRSQVEHSTTKSLCSLLVIRTGIHEMLVRIANREDPGQTASLEAV